MNSRLYFIAAFIFKTAAPQILTYTILPTSKFTLKCETTDLSSPILFKLNNINKGGCNSTGTCSTGILGYETPTQVKNITEMVITSCIETRDIGSWTCVYGDSTSSAVTIADCSEGTNTKTENDNSGPEVTNTKPDNDNNEGLVIGVVIGVIATVLVILVLVLVVWMLKKKKFFNNDAAEEPRPQRQQPDGYKGPQSTPKDPDARLPTTERPLPRRRDIASPQTFQVDSVNSPRPIVLAPIENPNIIPSIDPLDEQKTDKKPNDKKKK